MILVSPKALWCRPGAAENKYYVPISEDITLFPDSACDLLDTAFKSDAAPIGALYGTDIA